MIDLDTLAAALGSPPHHAQIRAFLEQIDASSTSTEPEIKAYPDVVYHNYRALGVSLQYESATAGKAACTATSDDLKLAAIDIYSAHEDKNWSCFPGLPLEMKASPAATGKAPIHATIALDSTGKDLVSMLGEPQRKGGGAGGRSGPAAWMEWTLQLNMSDTGESNEVKLQIELAGAGARGADRWNAERAGTCPWAVITIS